MGCIHDYNLDEMEAKKIENTFIFKCRCYKCQKVKKWQVDVIDLLYNVLERGNNGSKGISGTSRKD